MSMIAVENLVKDYPGTRALDAVSFEVGEGGLYAYLGPNGSGKTTTIRILTGLTRPTSGAARIAGHDVFADGRRAKQQCGLVPQAVNLDRDLSVWQNLDQHGRYFGVPAKARKARIGELLAAVGLEDRARSLVKTLSGGMQRRVMIARALVHEPRVLFLDEPTAGLDPAIRRQIWALVKDIQKNGATVFLTTHYIEEAEFLADRVAFLCEGRIAAVDTPERFITHLGEWAVDHYGDGRMESQYFHDRDEALALARSREVEFRLRRVNLEDAFLRMTGKRVG
ncbi:MAG: ABC transporter ATP-binding protein [Desulfatibacillaceae bacterium]